MAAYPTQVDNSDTLFVGADRLGAYTLETTLTAACSSSDTTIAVADAIGPGFAAAAMHLRIGDEIVRYTGRTATTFTGLSRGLGSTASAHAAGTPVKATFTWLQIFAMQQAIIAIENVIGITGAYNFAAASHAHAAADITSGTIATARLPVYSGSTPGIVPTNPGGTGKYLDQTGAFSVPPGGGAANAAALPSTAFTGIEATNVQAALEEIAAERASLSHGHTSTEISHGGGSVATALDARVPTSRQVTASGAGLSGGGTLSGDISFSNTGVTSWKGVQNSTRTGPVQAEAGDYRDYQVDCSPSGWPTWMNSASTVRQALDALIAELGSVRSDLASRYTNNQIDSAFNNKASNTHVHNETGTQTGGPIG